MPEGSRRETFVVGRIRHGLPYSKGVMAQALSASGLAPERAYELARRVEQRLAEREEERIDVDRLWALAEEVLGEHEDEDAVRRFRDWRRLDRLDRPLVVLIGGTTGVGKSTLATMLANRLGITRVIATDVIRQVLRAFFSHDFMPAVHYSAFEAGAALEGDEATGDAADDELRGFEHQADSVGTAIAAIVERACAEGTPLLVEGVHVVPGCLDPELRARCVAVEALLTVEDAELHRGHFALRGSARPAERYLEGFDAIRRLQDFLHARAREEGIAVIDNASADQALGRLMGLVLDTVGRLEEA
jgi:2-phosphoglycerate kinase